MKARPPVATRSPFTIALFIFVLAFVGVMPAMAAPATNAEPTAYVALGDSIAVGVGASRVDKGYVPRFFHSLTRHAGTDLALNLAMGGATSSSFIQSGQLTGAVEAIDESSDVQVVTLTIGGNDLLFLLQDEPCLSAPASLDCRQAVTTALGTFIINYQQILTGVTLALGRDPGDEVLLVTTYYNPFGGTTQPIEVVADLALTGSDGTISCAANAVDPTRIGLNDLIACVGQQFDATVVDLYPVFGRDALRLTHIAKGDIHPNNEGYAVIANAVKKAWKQATRALK